jgi:hypothetical protein
MGDPTTMSGVPPVRALYYPRTHFGSLGWVKAALLYWESLARIVPEGFAPVDPPEVYELVAAGLIENVSPAHYQHAAGRTFLKRLQTVRRLHGELSPCLGRARTPKRPGKYSMVHIGKIEPELLRDLKAYGLAATAGDWVTMTSEMADLYMITLGDEMVAQLHAARTTDEPRCAAAPAYFAQQKLVGEPNWPTLIDGYAFARSLAPFPSLEAATLPIGKVLKVRQKYARERRAFRDFIQTRASELGTLPSVEAIDSHLRDLKTELENESESQRRARRTSRAQEAWKFVGIGSPASVGAVATAVGAPPLIGALGGIASLGAGVTERALSRRPGRQPALRYLVSLEVLLGGAQGLGARWDPTSSESSNQR